MNKVVIVRDRQSAGGGIHHYYQVLSRHLSMNHAFVDIGRPHDYFTKNRVGALNRITLLRLIGEWMVLISKLLRFPDLVHLNPGLDLTSQNSLRRDAVSLCLAKLFRRKVLVFWRGWDSNASIIPEFPGGNAGWLSRIYRLADAHIVLASQFHEDLRRWGFITPIYQESTVVGDELFDSVDPSLRCNRDQINLLFLSRVAASKGIFEILECFRLLQIHAPGRYTLTYAGDGPELQALRERVHRMHITDIQFTGYVSGQMKAECYSNASIFVFPSDHHEGMPNAVLEAMAAGLPLVTSTAGGLKDFLADGENGYLLTPDRKKQIGERFEPVTLAARIEALAADHQLRKSIGLFNRSYAQQHFAASVVAHRLQSIYMNVISGDYNGGRSQFTIKQLRR
jgi:glycosyltransferase involved in cell wall biosynthesis